MDTEDKYKWLRQYARPCFIQEKNSLEKLPNIKTIEEFLEGNYSREKVRDYFFIPHNLKTLKDRNYIHLLIPYIIEYIGDRGLTCTVSKPFYEELPISLCSKFLGRIEIEKARSLGILEKIKKKNILIVHSQEIVDSCKKQELKKYHYLYANELILK